MLEDLTLFGMATLPEGSPRGHVRLRAVVVAEAADQNWIVPGRRLGQSLLAAEGLLNLYNPNDEALDLYPFTLQSGQQAALGRVGLTDHDRKRLGPLVAKYQEVDIEPNVGPVHTLLGALAQPAVARRLAPYTFADEAAR